jgi:hypothetical protein
LLSVIFVWIVLSMVMFSVAITAMPPDKIDQTGVFWLAVLAIAWPLLLLFSALGIAFTYAANLLRAR